MPSVRRQSFGQEPSGPGLIAVVGSGLLVGGLITAFAAMVIGAFGSGLPFRVRMAVAGAVAMGCLVLEASRLPHSLPQRTRLIPSERLALRAPYGVFLFGVELGVGWRTAVPSTLPYALACLVAAFATWPAAMSVAAGWALGRWGPIAGAVHRKAIGDRTSRRWAEPRVTSLLGLSALLAVILWQTAGT